MDLKVSCICPPIPIRKFDYACYDANTYDIDGFDGETMQPTSSCPVGYGPTPEMAIIDFVYMLLDKHDISMVEVSQRVDYTCDKCEERPATHQALVREEMLSDERGTVWGHVDMWLCDECDRESGPDPDMLYDEWRDRQMEEGL